MTTFPNSPRLVKGGIVILNPTSGAVQLIIPLQYNPDTLTRTLQVQGAGAEGGDRAEALRLKGPPVETIKLEAEIDATDALGQPNPDPLALQYGIHPHLAALEILVYPTSQQLMVNNSQAQSGQLEIAPAEAPMTLLIWGQSRILPVRLTEFSITEEAFDTALNPIRAKVSLGMRVLSVNDLGFEHKGGNLYMVYQREKERLAGLFKSGSFGTLGIGGLP